MTPFEQAYAEVADLVRDFEAHESEYLSPKYQESEVRTDFLDKFWAAFGWDVRHKYQTNPREQEVKVEKNPDGHTSSRKADYAFHLMPDYRTVVFFCEAKKPSVALGNPESYFQLVRYGRGASTPVGVLTDFEEFHIVDCRYEANLQKSFPSAQIRKFHYREYLDLDAFGYIYWLFSREAIEQGKLKEFTKTLPKQRGKGAAKLTAEEAKPTDEKFLDTLEDYRLRLAKAFKKADESLTAEQLTEATMKVIDRLVFVRFLEDKNIEADYIIDQIAGKKGAAWKSFVAWSKELDVKYNGVVFKPHDIDQPSFAPPDDKVFADICTELSHSHSKYIFSYIPVELLGSIYERFLGKVVTATAKRADIEYKPEVRKAGGVYYTPKYIVDYIVENTVGKILTNAEAPPQRGGVGVVSSGEGLAPKDVAKLRFADIACGSGSFLIAVYDAVLHHVESYYNAHPDEAKKAGCVEIDNGVWALGLKQKQRILLDNIYGVDIDPQAVEVAQLSLFLKLLEGESGATAGQMSFEKTKILPDLSKNIVCGNSLVDYDIETLFKLEAESEHRIKPFNFDLTFRDVLAKGGFDAVVGNPPYIRIQAMKEWAPDVVHYLGERYSTASVGNYDIYTVFIQKALSLLQKDGLLGYIVPHKFFNSKYGEPLRRLIAESLALRQVVHFGDAQVFKGASTYTCILVLSKNARASFDYVRITDLEAWRQAPNSHLEEIDSLYATALEWNFAVGKDAELFDRLKNTGKTFGDITKMFVGLQTSADTVFLFKDVIKNGQPVTQVYSKELERTVSLESSLLKPVVRSGSISRYQASPTALVLFPYVRTGNKYILLDETSLRRDFPLTWEYLNLNKKLLSAREHGKFVATGWYQLYPKNLDVWEQPKLLVPYMVTRLAALPDYENLFFVNVTTGGFGVTLNDNNWDLKLFSALLNSKLLDWFFKKVTTTFNSGYYAANKQYLSQLPVPLSIGSDQNMEDSIIGYVDQMLDAKKRLASARSDSERTQLERKCDYLDAEIDKLVYQLYGLTEEEIGIVEENKKER